MDRDILPVRTKRPKTTGRKLNIELDWSTQLMYKDGAVSQVETGARELEVNNGRSTPPEGLWHPIGLVQEGKVKRG